VALWNLESPTVRAPILRYGFSAACVATALALALILQSYGFRDASLPLLALAVALAAWYAGRGPSVLAVLLSTAAFNYFFVQPLYSLAVSIDDLPYFLFFVAWALIVAVFATVRRRVERDLRQARDDLQVEVEQRTRQAQLLDQTHDSISVRDIGDLITYWNRGAEDLYGWRRDEALGKTAHDLFKTIFPISYDRTKAELLSNGRWDGELVRTRKDGTQVTVASRWSLQRDSRGAPVAVLETNNDITERKRAEQERQRLRELEADLMRVNRVSMMAELAASLTHEVKQPIAAIDVSARACLQWLDKKPPAIERARDSVTRIVKDANRAVDIVDRNRSLYTRTTTPCEAVDLNEVVRQMLVLLRDPANRHSVSIRTELDPALPATKGDRIQLQQVLMNLMLNGIEAMAVGSGELHVGSMTTEHGEIMISVSDSGIGLPAEGPERIFDAFFTTKPHGTGMGLSISRRIIESHGGRLWASPRGGRGTTFRFTLPVGE
jgi:two-component system, LuxR family, sensor kinase FixL